jgi:hypothetical protein
MEVDRLLQGVIPYPHIKVLEIEKNKQKRTNKVKKERTKDDGENAAPCSYL